MTVLTQTVQHDDSDDQIMFNAAQVTSVIDAPSDAAIRRMLSVLGPGRNVAQTLKGRLESFEIAVFRYKSDTLLAA